MDVKLEKKDDLNALISIFIGKDDYAAELEKQLKAYRKQAKIPGFRPGQVPLGMVKKMVGKSILYDEVNKLTSNTLYDYLKEHDIDILGQPMTSESKESKLDFDNYGDFEFHFDLGLAPEFELKISDKDKFTKYDIQLEDDEVEKEIKNITRQNGKLENQDKVETENDSIVVLLTEVDKSGNHKDGGVFEQEATILPEIIKDKKTKKELLDLKVDDEISVNIQKLFNENEMVISHSLGIEKEAVNDLNKTFKLKVKEIRKVVPAAIDQGLFDQVFGPGVVSTEEEFRTKIEENLKMYYQGEAEKQLEAEINDFLQDKHKLKLPDDFLKRWLVQTKPETYTEENIDEKYAEESEILRKQLIREKIANEQDIEVTAEDLDETSFAYTAQILRQYGINNPDPQLIQNLEAKNREDRDYMLRIRDVVMERKVLDAVKNMVNVKGKKIAIEKFYELVKKFNEKLNK
ncbi:trigger factor [bacterium]|nr:trigger factor [bacterium]